VTSTGATPAAQAQREETESASKPRRHLEPAHLVILLVGLAITALSVGPLTEIDSYWHVLVGNEILSDHRISGVGNAWSLYTAGNNWATSQWASEVIMALAVKWFGWSGLMWLRTVLVAALLGLLARSLLTRATPRAAALVVAIVMIPAVPSMQERPMLASFVFLVWLSGAAYDVLVGRRTPPWWQVGLLVVIWANLHGLWVLAPAAFALAGLCLAIDRDPASRPRVRTALVLTGVAGVAGCLTPLGPKGLLLPFTFSSATAQISEWQRTTPWAAGVAGLLLLSAILIGTWARQDRAIPWSHVLYWGAWTLFAFLAFRNVVPATLMLAPLAAAAVSRQPRFARSPVGAPEQQAILVVGLLFAVIGASWIAIQTARTDPLEKSEPLVIARALADIPGEKRVFNGYNSAGVLAAFGGDGIKLAIDGRSDRFGGDYIARYVDAMDLTGDWQQLINNVDPDYAVIASDNALAHELATHQGWTLVMTDRHYSLLKAPAGPPLPNR